jgi:amidophosphoribosyltransferase
MPAANELVANKKSNDEIRQAINADGLIFLDLEQLYLACREGNAEIERFEDSVFTGNYVTGDVTDKYLDKVQHQRGE